MVLKGMAKQMLTTLSTEGAVRAKNDHIFRKEYIEKSVLDIERILQSKLNFKKYPKELQEEMKNVATIALYEAIQRFDTSYNVKFTTYAGKYIVGRVLTYLKGQNFSYCDINELQVEAKNNTEKEVVETTFYQEFSNVLSKDEITIINLRLRNCRPKEIAKLLGVSTKTIRRIMKDIQNKYNSYNDGKVELVKRRRYSLEKIEKKIKKTLL